MDDTDDMKFALLHDIRQHIREYGSKRWKILQVKYPKVSEREFFRFVAKVKEGAPDQEILRQAVKKAKRAARKALPVAPSPAIIAEVGGSINDNINFMRQLQGLLSDIDMVRAYSTTEDADGNQKIKNPLYFTQSIRLRRDVLETALHAMQEIWDLRRMQDFYDTIIQTISEADPSTARLIMERLDALNNERGITINAKV